MLPKNSSHTWTYLKLIGAPELPPLTSPFDPGYDPATLEGHLEQSSHLIAILKISMACWMVANEAATRRKVAAAAKYQRTDGHRRRPVRNRGGAGPPSGLSGPLRRHRLHSDRVRRGFYRHAARRPRGDCDGRRARPRGPVRTRQEAHRRLQLKHRGQLIAQGRRWLDAGARELVVEARESAKGVGLFDDDRQLQRPLADRFADEFGLDMVTYEAPTKPSQFALLDHFGPQVRLCNVRLEELLRVEIYRRGLHSDAFCRENLRPRVLTEQALRAS